MAHLTHLKLQPSSVDPREIDHFSAHARGWWNPRGPMRPLHELNPIRLQYIRGALHAHGLWSTRSKRPLKGLSILDVGCGAGLVCEPLSRLGAHVEGLDASAQAIDEAKAHAKASGLTIAYRLGSTEELVGLKKRYDVITALEIVEHVVDLGAFVRSLAALLKPSGVVIFSTLNRTPKSFLLGVVAAEYVLRWVPKGTHTWTKFVRPSEIAVELGKNGLELKDVTGVVYKPLEGIFAVAAHKTDVNYIMTATKASHA